MHTIRATCVVTSLGACTLLALAFQTPTPKHGDEPTPKLAGEIFAQRCSTCHVAPDLAFATDRAWVDQVQETA